MLDNDYDIDLSELRRMVKKADVLCLYFPMLRKTLVLDNRSNERAGPFVMLGPMVANAQERLDELERMRPGFGTPEAMVLAPWPKRVATLAETGILQLLIDHFEDLGASDAATALQRAYEDLAAAEREDILNAIRGDHYRTVWAATR